MCSGPGRDLYSFDKCRAEVFCISFLEVCFQLWVIAASHTHNFTSEKGDTEAQLLLAVGLRHGIAEASPQPIHDSLVWSQDIAGTPSKGCVMVEQVQLRQGGAWNGEPTAARWVQHQSDRSSPTGRK